MFKLVASFIWFAGIVLANGFWSTFFSIFFPPWAWYIVVEKMLSFGGFLT